MNGRVVVDDENASWLPGRRCFTHGLYFPAGFCVHASPEAWLACLLLLAPLSLVAPARADRDPGTAAAASAAPGPVMPEPITPIPPPPLLNSAKLALGERLFADPRLSRDNRRSCATCHDIRTNGAGSVRTNPGSASLRWS